MLASWLFLLSLFTVMCLSIKIWAVHRLLYYLLSPLKIWMQVSWFTVHRSASPVVPFRVLLISPLILLYSAIASCAFVPLFCIIRMHSLVHCYCVLRSLTLLSSKGVGLTTPILYVPLGLTPYIIIIIPLIVADLPLL